MICQIQHLYIVFVFILFLTPRGLRAQLADPITVAHAHNDYEKARQPLYAALRSGFVSIEVDVFPHRSGQLKVAHIPLFLSAANNLETLYFKPLQAWLDQHKKIFKRPEQSLTFMTDIKQSPEQSYALLRQLCTRYADIIEHYIPAQDSLVAGPLKIILSGRKPYQAVLQDSIQYMGLDGSPESLQDSLFSAWLMPRISMPYHRFMSWKGHRPIRPAELQKLKDFIGKVHKYDRKLRFWALPENNKIWKLLLDEGIDWIQVDHLPRFQKFYKQYKDSIKHKHH